MKHRTIIRSGDRTAQSSEFNVPAPRLRPSVHAVRHALRGLATVAALQFATPAAFALPTGEQLISGNATVARNGAGTVMDITQTTPKASLNWTSFSIAAPETVNVAQPDTSSVLLNRVIGNDQSQIFGALNANGKVFLVNPNGILFAPGAAVNVGGLVASTLDITDANFNAGTYQFDRVAGSAPGSVVNQGNIEITVANSYAALIGTNVSNEGTIKVISTAVAKRGAVALAAGNRVTLNMLGDALIGVSVDAAAAGASILNKNGAQILADGGNVFLTVRSADALLGTVINMDGLIRANTLTTGENGTIILDGGSHRVSVAGTMEAHGTDPATNGGTVTVSGREIVLASSATIDVNGVVADGTIGLAIGEGGGASGNLTIGSGTTLLGDNINVTGNAGTDTITVTRDVDMTLTDAALTVGTDYTLNLTSIEAANLTGGASANAITASAFTGAVSVNASGGADTVTGNGANTTFVGANADSNWDVTGANAATYTSGTDTTALTGVGNLVGGTEADTFTLAAAVTTFNGSIAGGGGTDTLAATDGTNAWSITGANSGKLNTSTTFSGISNLVGGSADDTLTGVAAGSSWSITGANAATVSGMNATNMEHLVGGTGADAFTLATGVTSFNGSIAGGGGIDTLAATDGTNAWTIDGSNSGTLNTTTTFTGISNLTGGSDGDMFTFGAAGIISGLIDGGVGIDSADYSASTAVTTVTLGTGVVNVEALTGAAGQTLIGANIANTWSITGDRTGEVNDGDGAGTVAFSGFDALKGGTSTDSFTLASAVTTFNGSIAGGGGSDTLAATDGTNAWTVDGSNSGTLNTTTTFSGISKLTGGSGADTFTFGAAGTLAGLIDGGTGADAADYSASTAVTTVTLGTSVVNVETLTGAAGQTLVGANIANTWSITGDRTGEVNDGDGAGTVAFSGFDALKGGTSTDSFTLASAVTTFNGSIAGGGGIDTLAATDGANAWAVTGANSGTLNTTTAFSDISNLSGGSDADTFVLSGTSSVSGTIDGGGGINRLQARDSNNDWLINGNNSGLVTNVSAFTNIQNLTGGTQADNFVLAGTGNVTGTIDGGAGSNRLQARDVANTWHITGSNAGDVTNVNAFTNIQNLRGGNTSDTFIFADAASVASVDGHGGPGTLDFSAYTTPVDVTLTSLAPVGFNGTTAGTVNPITGPFVSIDSLKGPAGQANTLTGANILLSTWSINAPDAGTYSTGGNSLAFSGYQNLTGGAGSDQFVLSGTGSVSGTIDGGTGSNSLQARDQDNTWSITGLNSGSVSHVNAFTNIQSLLGGTGGDTFIFTDAASVSSIDGRGGIDKLDFSNYTTPVDVTLTAVGGTDGFNGTTSGPVNPIATSFSNIDAAAAPLAPVVSKLTGADVDATWSINGLDSGTYASGANSLAFTGYENLTGGAAADSFTLSLAGSVSGTIDGGGGTNSLQARDVANIWNITGLDAGSVTNVNAFTNIQNLVGGTSIDTFIFTDAASVSTINGRNGSDTLVFANYTTPVDVTLTALGGIDGFNGTTAGPVNPITGSFSNIDAAAAPLAPVTSKLTGANVDASWSITSLNSGTYSSGANSLAFGGYENLTGGTAADSFTLSLTGSVTGTIDGGGGLNSLQARDVVNIWNITGPDAGNVTNVNAFANIQNMTGGGLTDSFVLSGTGSVSGTIDGGGGVNSLQARDVENTWTINGGNQGIVTNVHAFTHIHNLVGGSSTDIFNFCDCASVSSIDGRGGVDTLNLALYATKVDVTLTGLGAIDGFNGTTAGTPNPITGSFSNIDAVTGPAGQANTLTGANVTATWSLNGSGSGSYTSGANALAYSGFRNLTGGTGADTFTGNGGSIAGALTDLGGPTTLNNVLNLGSLNLGVTTLGSNTTVSAGSGDVTFTSTVDGAFDLAVNTSGATKFMGDVGGTAALNTLTTDAPGTTMFGANVIITTTGVQTYNDPVSASTVTLRSTGGGSILAANTANDFTGTLTVMGGTVNVTDANALSVQLTTTGDTYVLANAAGGTGDLTIGGSSGNLIAVTNGGGLTWNTLTAPNAIFIAAAPVISGTNRPGDITGPGSKGNAVDDVAVTYINRNDARAMGDLTIGNQFVLVARDAPKVDADSTVQAGSAVFNIAHLVPANRLRVILTDPTGTLRLLASEGDFRFRAGSGFAGGVTTLNPNAVGVFIADVPISSTRDQLSARAAVSAAQQSALNSASADARQSFGTDSVTQQIDMGFAGDVGIAPTMAHNVPLEGEIISTPPGVSESKAGDSTAAPAKCNPDPKTGECK